MEHRKVTAIVILDLSAAFDTVDFNVLLDIPQMQIWNNRQSIGTGIIHTSMKVCINNSYSKPRQLKYGVPQGSCSGANIFTNYCSPIQDVVPTDIKLIGFADDHSIRQGFNPNDRQCETSVIQSLQDTTIAISEWMSEMRLKLNEDKTEFILVGYRDQLKKTHTSQVEINGNLINLSTVVKYLGAHIDSNLSFNQHITEKCRVAMANLMKIRSIRKYLDRNACAGRQVIGVVKKIGK